MTIPLKPLPAETVHDLGYSTVILDRVAAEHCMGLVERARPHRYMKHACPTEGPCLECDDPNDKSGM